MLLFAVCIWNKDSGAGKREKGEKQEEEGYICYVPPLVPGKSYEITFTHIPPFKHGSHVPNAENRD